MGFVIKCDVLSMESVKEQRMCVIFCFKVRKTAAETHSMLREAHGNDTLSQTTTYKWFKRFKNGRTIVVDDEWSGRPSASRFEPLIAQVKNIIHVNCRLSEKLQKRLEYPLIHATQF
jgi:hypothetical protein